MISTNRYINKDINVVWIIHRIGDIARKHVRKNVPTNDVSFFCNPWPGCAFKIRPELVRLVPSFWPSHARSSPSSTWNFSLNAAHLKRDGILQRHGSRTTLDNCLLIVDDMEEVSLDALKKISLCFDYMTLGAKDWRSLFHGCAIFA